ncbi:acetyltransferase component 1 of pyruvate dehydrogenase complex, mitochondrial [Seminavis robusta]|uniref:Dihydrolipoamide acetyltransferase component of pyruvate dehydrogenase complex n=1 Tax=Seminavis robusta TaxID=568900 RepID=A0A9N8HPQ6_9STRA|nr:acetyltransferase component 1 of pyruvate dehydrogenase complex, mitochondrial [Seminavis robusta]|eukprot:Sro1117_g243010.1 acetyltransferase component 1 of pyruvate dehydrogenase complex, mitochondrial (533) ;mRNA; f:26365-27963
MTSLASVVARRQLLLRRLSTSTTRSTTARSIYPASSHVLTALSTPATPTSLVSVYPATVSSNSCRYYSVTTAVQGDYPEHTLFPMPALSPTMESGTISSWALEEGQEFSAGDVLCSIETDKASVDFEAQDDGILAKILIQAAEDVPIGTPICVVVEEASDVAAFAGFVAPAEEPSTTSSASSTASATTEAPTPTATTPAAPSGQASLLFPSARHLSESKGLDATVLEGSGKGGRVTKGDVLKAIADGVAMPALATKAATTAPTTPTPATPAAAAPVPSTTTGGQHVEYPVEEVVSFGSYEDVPNSKMRKTIASRLTQSKREVPHFYTSIDVQLDNVMKLRKQLVNDHEVKVSVNDLIIRCCALALRDVPEVNASYDSASNSIKTQSSIDVSVAVATPTGLITPIVPNTDKLGLSGITNKVRDLATRARDGKLAPQEYQGGTFCVSNLGMFGINEFSAVINPPQAAILAVGGGTRLPMATPYVDGADEQAKPSIKTVMTARLSADRRVVDEPTAALFLQTFRQYIQQPELCML